MPAVGGVEAACGAASDTLEEGRLRQPRAQTPDERTRAPPPVEAATHHLRQARIWTEVVADAMDQVERALETRPPNLEKAKERLGTVNIFVKKLDHLFETFVAQLETAQTIPTLECDWGLFVVASPTSKFFSGELTKAIGAIETALTNKPPNLERAREGVKGATLALFSLAAVLQGLLGP